MLEINESVKTLLQKDNVKKNIRISFPNGELPDLTNKDIVQDSFSFTESLCSQTDLKLGLCEASVITFEVVGIDNIKGYKIKADCEVDCSSLGTEWCEENATTSDDVPFPYYSIPYGVFYVDKCPRKSGRIKNYRTVTAYTKEAANDWELPESIKAFFNCGWYEPKTFGIPTKLITKAMFPETCEGTPVRVTSHNAEWPTTSNIPYIDENGNTKQFNYYYSNCYTAKDPRTYNSTDNVLVFTGHADDQAVINKVVDTIDVLDEIIKSAGGGGIVNKEYYKERYSKYPYYSRIGYQTRVTPSHERYTCTVSGDNYTYTKYESKRINVGNFPNTYEKVEGDYKKGIPYLANRKVVSGSYQTFSAYDMYESPNVLTRLGNVLTGCRIVNFPYDLSDLEEYKVGNFDYDFNIASLYTFTDSDVEDIEFKFTTDNSKTGEGYGERYTENPYEGTRTDTTILTPTMTTNYLGQMPEINLMNIIQSDAELQGKMGKFDRYGNFSYISISGATILYPEINLYPNEDLFPEGNDLILPKVYKTAEWEDEFSKPYDKVIVTYKNENNEEVTTYIALVNLEAEGYFSENYQSYDLSNNYYIKNQTFTEEQITELLQTVADNVSNIRYMPSEVIMRGMPYIEAGDYMVFRSTDNQEFKTIALRNTIDGEMYLTQTIQSN